MKEEKKKTGNTDNVVEEIREKFGEGIIMKLGISKKLMLNLSQLVRCHSTLLWGSAAFRADA